MSRAPFGARLNISQSLYGPVKVFSKQSDQAHLILGVPSHPIEHPDRYALQVLSTVLGGGMLSR